MLLTTLVTVLLSADAAPGAHVYLQEDATREIGKTVTIHGMVRTLPAAQGMERAGVALDDGTPI